MNRQRPPKRSRDIGSACAAFLVSALAVLLVSAGPPRRPTIWSVRRTTRSSRATWKRPSDSTPRRRSGHRTRDWSRSTRERPCITATNIAGPSYVSVARSGTRTSRPTAVPAPCTTSATAWFDRPARPTCKQLQAAIDCYELALRETSDDGIRSDAGHNLEVAKLLWAKARRAGGPRANSDPEWDEPQQPKQPPPDPLKPPEGTDRDAMEGDKKLEPGPKLDIGKGPNAGMTPKEAERAAPGQGNLPVLPDTEEFRSIPLEDVRAELKRAERRMLRERLKVREEAAQGERPRANDW